MKKIEKKKEFMYLQYPVLVYQVPRRAKKMPAVGVEPTTTRLKVLRSTD